MTDLPAVESDLFNAVKSGDVERLTTLLDAHPEQLHARAAPHQWSLLHLGHAHVGVVDLLLRRGLDVNTRESGDNTYAMHWAAAGGHLDAVRRLVDAGGDVIGSGDDHDLEVIGWATCWDGRDDPTQRAVAEFLVSRGARHHIFSAIALNLADDVRRIAAADPLAVHRRQSRNENNQTPLHFAVAKRRPEMMTLLLELGADALAVDAWGMPVAVHATTPDADRPVMEAIHAMTQAELVSAQRGHRLPRGGPLALLSLLALGEREIAEQMLRENPALVDAGSGVLHLMTKRNDVTSVRWLLEHGANPSGRWAHWDAMVTPLHLAAMQGHVEIARVLLSAGADATIRDSRHDGDAVGWASFFNRPEMVEILKSQTS